MMASAESPETALLARRDVSRWRSRLIVVGLFAVVLPIGAAILHQYRPGESIWFPRCVFLSATNLYCPGCGATRCLHSLLHGHFAQAFAFNPLLVVALPLLILGGISEAYIAWTGRALLPWRLSRKMILAIFWIVVAYWIARNFNFYPFKFLAPGDLMLE